MSSFNIFLRATVIDSECLLRRLLNLVVTLVLVEAEFGLNPVLEGVGGLSEAVAPDVLSGEKCWGLGFFHSAEAALSASRFLCSRFHYIRVRRGGVGRQLGCGPATQ